MERAIQLGNVPVWSYVHLAIACQTIGDTESAKQAVANIRGKFPSFSVSAIREALVLPKERLEVYEASLRQLGVLEE